jgi:hypothetical protein
MLRRALVFVAVLGTATLMGCTTPPTGPPPNQVPLAIFSPSTSNGAAPLDVDFDASTSSDPDGTIVAWNWDFGDFSTGSGQTVSHSFEDPGSYTVTLSVTDNRGAVSSSDTVITVFGPPAAPTGLSKTGSGCCDTYGDFAWNAVPGATLYQIEMDGYFGGGCTSDHSATLAGPTTGRVQAVGLCLGSKYNVRIRAQANGLWGAWSPTINITL